MRTLRLAALCCAFGCVTGWLGAASGPFASAVANLSAPWILVALLPGMGTSSARRGAVLGLGCTAVALTAFYLTKTLVLSGQNGGGGVGAEFLVEARANRIYLVAGAVTGPLFGAAGAVLRRHRQRIDGLTLAGLLLSTEVAVVAAASGRRFPFSFSWAVDSWTAYWLECLVGIAVTAVAVRRRCTTHGRLP